MTDALSPAAPTREALDDFLCFAVYSTGLAFSRAYRPLLDRLGLTYPQYLAIVALADRDDRTVGELGDLLFLDSNTLTPLIKRLESAGLVSRRRDSADERVVRVSLTAAGRAIVDQAACVPDAILQATGLPVEDLAALNRALVALRTNLRAAA
jgi:DNA-binding MarR family transcriptional regulator